MLKLIATAILSASISAGATYGTLQVTTTCQIVPEPSQQAAATQRFLSGPDLPLTGWPRH